MNPAPFPAGDGGKIEIAVVRKVFRGLSSATTALNNVSLTIDEGEFLCIVGPSGCGKTTLLRILAGLESPTEGSVTFGGWRSDRPLRSMVFQEQGVFPWLTVIENAAFGLAVRGVRKEVRNRAAMGYLQKLGLADFATAYPRQLSGGMRQRVNLARAFANDPSVLLMDEPLASVDEQTKMLIQEDLLRLWEGSQKTVIYITHSLDEAIVLGDRVAVMTNRPGRIKDVFPVAIGRPRQVLELRNNEQFLEIRRRVWVSLREEVKSLREAGATA